MNYFEALIFAIVEGFSEFLPISSTGHLILTSHLLGIPQTNFVKSFEIIIQLGAILAVVFLFWKRIINSKKTWKPLLFAFMPTVVIGGLFYKIIKDVFLGNELIVVYSLFIGGIILIAVEYFFNPSAGSGRAKREEKIERIEDITPTNALIIGLFQSISIIPGVSRSAASIIGAMLLGTKRKTAVEFSFLLAIPTMAAATGLDLIRSEFSFTSNEWGVLAVGFIGSFVVAIFAVKFFLKFVESHTFIPFGIYRIILALLFFLYILN